MIKIELTFTSIAAAAAALALLNSDAATTPVRDTPSGAVKPKATKSETEPTKTAEPTKTETKAEKPATPAVEYKDVQAATMKLAAIGANEEDEAKQVGRQAVKAVLKQMGLESFKGSDASCWPTAVALLTAKHAELTADA